MVRDGDLSSKRELGRAIDEEGWSVQVMHPQRRSSSVHALLFDLENETGSLWGANSYITPPASQGFKPHYDDVEVFMLQLEGRKRWRIFAGVELAREYSPADFQEEELGEPLLDEWLEAGDTLYFPRGTIHYGVTCSEHGSHHLTVSTYQKSCWADMIGDSLKAALAEVAETDVQFRMGLPLKWTGLFGSGVSSGIGLAAAAESHAAKDALVPRVGAASQKSAANQTTRRSLPRHNSSARNELHARVMGLLQVLLRARKCPFLDRLCLLFRVAARGCSCGSRRRRRCCCR